MKLRYFFILLISIALISGCTNTGCCHPPCVQSTEEDCKMYYGNEWNTGDCSPYKECEIGCCYPGRVQKMKWECDDSFGTSGEWKEGECEESEWVIDEVFDLELPPDGTEREIENNLAFPTPKIKRKVIVNGKPTEKADIGEFGYQSDWEITITEDFEFETVETSEELIAYSALTPFPTHKIECSWKSKPSFSAKMKITLDLSTDNLDKYYNPEEGVFPSNSRSIVEEKCNFNEGEFTCTQTCIHPDCSGEEPLIRDYLAWFNFDWCKPYEPDPDGDTYYHSRWKRDSLYNLPDVYLSEMTKDGADIVFGQGAWNTIISIVPENNPVLKIKKVE